MTGKFGDHGLYNLEQRFQALRDQIGAMPEACRPELEGALLELSQAIAALRADREAGENPRPASSSRLGAPAGQAGKELLNQLLLDALPCVAFLLRPGTREIVASNAEAVKAGAIPGAQCFSTWGRREEPCPWCRAPALWATGEAQHLEVEALGVAWDAHWIPVAEDLYMHFAFDVTAHKQAESARQESKGTLRTLIEANPESLLLLDTRGEILAASRVAAERLGKELPEIVGRSAFDDLPPEVASRRWERFEQVIATGRPLRVEDMRGDRHFDITFTPILDADGKVSRVSILAVDITDRKNAEQALRDSEERFRAIVATAQDSIFIKDRSFRYVQVNPAMERLFGRSAAGIIGKNDIDLFGTEAAARIRKQDHLVFSGEMVKEVHTVPVLKVPTTFHVIKMPLYDDAGEIAGICGIARDITDLKQAEAALQESEERFRMLFEHVPDAYILADMQGEIIDCNQATAELAGYGREELIGNNFACLPWLDFRQQVRLADLLAQTARGEVMGPVDFTLTHKNGSEVIAEGMNLPLSIQGQILVLTIVRDITARKQAEAELRESERQKSIRNEILQIFLTASDEDMYTEVLQVLLRDMKSRFGVFAYKDEHGALVAPSMTSDIWEQCQVADKTMRFPPETWGDNIWARAIRQKRSLWKNEPGVVPEGHLPIENVMVVPLLYRGEVFAHFEVANKPGGYGEADKVWLEDIAQFIAPVLHARLERNRKEADRQQAEAALKESEARFRHISSTISDISYSCTTGLDGRYAIDWLAGAVERITGYSAEEVQAWGCWKCLVVEADQPRFEEHITGLAAGDSDACELRLRHKNGGIVWVASFAKVVQKPERPEFRHIYGGLVDITARKQAEAELRQSEQRFRLMAETIQDIFWISTPEIDNMVYVSPAYELVFGRPVAELYRSPQAFLESIHPEDREQAKSEIFTHQSQGLSFSQEYRVIQPDGVVRWIQDRGFPVRDDQGRVILYTGVATDITGRKALETQLLQAQKMEAVGRLAGGVAHDFNNLLMAITGYGELMRAKVLRDDPLYGYLENILKAGDRAAALTRQLLTFSRQKVVQPQVIDLNRVILDLEPLLRRLIGEDLHLEVVTDPRLGAVRADPGQIGQVIMNLVVNARDAMPQGGRLTLKISAVDLTESCGSRFGPAPPGSYVRLEVQDTGVGMDEATQAHIFEPFFTTKEPGKGTGLGLSTVYGIVKQSGGYLDLESSPGAGSTFTIYLPRLEAMVEPPKAKIPLTASFQGEETVLLVEDEDMLRGLLAKFLRLNGYTVLEARHGGEALLTCERHPGPIHLMVTDVVMPQMSGRELADRLSPLRPEMKILFMSGYTEEALVQHGVADLSVAFLQKPFRPIELARRVHAVLHPPVSQ